MNNVSNAKQGNQSENIIKLRALVERMENNTSGDENEGSRNSILDLRRLLFKERQKIEKVKDLPNKVSLYEELCKQITMLLSEIKII